jgi:hypothetical protein
LDSDSHQANANRWKKNQTFRAARAPKSLCKGKGEIIETHLRLSKVETPYS